MKRILTAIIMLMITTSVYSSPLLKVGLGDNTGIVRLQMVESGTPTDVSVTALTMNLYTEKSGDSCSGSIVGGGSFVYSTSNPLSGSAVELPYATDDRSSFNVAISPSGAYSLLVIATAAAGESPNNLQCVRVLSATANETGTATAVTYDNLPHDFPISCTGNGQTGTCVDSTAERYTVTATT